MQGPYEWQMMDAWLANGFVGEDLLVNRAGDSEWIALRDMAAKRAREGPRAPRSRGGAAPPPAPRPRTDAADPGTAANDKRRSEEEDLSSPRGGALADESARKRTVAVSSRYTESVDARIRRMVAEGKFGPALTRLATGGGKAGDSAAGGGGLGDPRRGSPAPGAGAPATDAKGSKRKAPRDAEAPAAGGATKKRATDSAGEKVSQKGEKEESARKNEWRHADGYAQLPVFEPAKPVEVPSRESEKATPDPRKKKEGKTDGEKPLVDLPVPAWCVEDAIEKRRRASDFDRGGPRPAADTKADDSDGEGSDVSWSALPGTGEPVELVEERNRAKQEAMRAANADILASEAAEAAAAAARAARAAAAEPSPPADAAGAARLALEAETAMCARDPDRGEWRVPVPSDGWRWRDDGVDAETLRREMDEAEYSGPRRVVARRETDDAFRVFGVPGYGEALRGVALDVPTGGSGNVSSDSKARSELKDSELSDSFARSASKESKESKQSRGGGLVKTAVFSAKRASSDEIRAWFASTTSTTSPKSPAAFPESERAGRADRATGGDTDGDLQNRAGDIEAFRASAANLGAGVSASEWFEAFTKDVALAVGEARRPAKTPAFFGAEVPAAGEKSEKSEKSKTKPVVATMAPSEAQEGACARVMGALHDAVMRQRARVFYELIRDDIKRYA